MEMINMAGIDPTTFWIVVGAGASVALGVGGVAYDNRRTLNRIRQRLFGLGPDASDDGVLVEMDRKLDNARQERGEIYEKLREMNGENSEGEHAADGGHLSGDEGDGR